MADLKISALPASTVPLAGTEVLPIVQGGSTKQVAVSNLTFPGTVVQTVSATYGTTTSSVAGSFVSSGLTASITPRFSTSKILVIASVPCAAQAVAASVILTLRRGASTQLQPSGFGFAQLYSGSSTGTYATQCIHFLDSPATTSSTDYTVLFSTTNGSVFANNADGVITLMEIKQ
jgi:hypothetical protein